MVEQMKVSKIVSKKGKGMVVKLLCGMLAHKFKVRSGRKQPTENDNTGLSLKS